MTRTTGAEARQGRGGARGNCTRTRTCAAGMPLARLSLSRFDTAGRRPAVDRERSASVSSGAKLAETVFSFDRRCPTSFGYGSCVGLSGGFLRNMNYHLKYAHVVCPF